MKQDTIRLMVYIPPEVFEEIKADAKAVGQSLSTWMIRAAVLRLQSAPQSTLAIQQEKNEAD